MKKLLDNNVFKLFFGLFKGCFYALVVLYLIFLIAQSMSGKGIAGYRVYTIRTGSMEPEYKVNDVILVKDTKVEDLKTGDVITYVADDTGKMTITHRIISINDNPDGSATIVTKGDANEVEDQAFNSSKVQGKLTYKFKIYSFITRLVNNKVTFFFLIFVPLVVTIFLDIADSVMEKEKRKEEQNTPPLKRRE